MSPENKQRVIGIVILVAFVALLIPFLFTSGIGRKKSSTPEQVSVNMEPSQPAGQVIENTGSAAVPVAQNAAMATSAPNQSQITAEAQGPVATNASVAPQAAADVSLPPEVANSNQAALPPLPSIQSDAELANITANALAAAETATKEQPADQTTATKALATTETATKEQPIDQATATGAVVPEPQKKIDETLLIDKMIKQSANTNTKVKVKTKIKTNAKSSGKAATANKQNNVITKKVETKKSGNWSVQVGSFTNAASVNKLVSQLRSKGFQAYLQKITKGDATMTRVLVGHEANKLAAAAINDKLSADLNITGHLVRN